MVMLIIGSFYVFVLYLHENRCFYSEYIYARHRHPALPGSVLLRLFFLYIRTCICKKRTRSVVSHYIQNPIDLTYQVYTSTAVQYLKIEGDLFSEWK